MFTISKFHHLEHTDIKNKWLLWRHMFIKSAGASFVSLFIPAVLYFEFGISLSGIFIYSMLHSIVAMIVMMLRSAKYVSRQWGRPAMVRWVVAFLVYMMLLYFWEFHSWLVFVAPIFSGLHTAFFWLWAHFTLADHASTNKSIGRTNALINQAVMVALIIWPFLWGLIADAMGQWILFIWCGVFILISLIPLLMSHKKHKELKFSVKKEFKFARKHFDVATQYFKTFASVAYVQFVWSVLWAITLFAFFQDYSSVWLISWLASIIVILIVRYIWKLSDINEEKGDKFVKLSTAFQWTNWFVAWLMIAAWFFSNTLFMIVDVFHKATYRVNNTYLTKIFYDSNDKITKKNVLYGIVIREAAIHGAKIMLCIVGAILFSLFDSIEYISIMYVLVALIVPLQLSLISRKKTVK